MRLCGPSRTCLLCVLALALSVSGCGDTPPASRGSAAPGTETLNVAFMYVGPIGDGGWTYAHDQARQEIEKEFPFVKTSYLESVPEGADAERVISDRPTRMASGFSARTSRDRLSTW